MQDVDVAPHEIMEPIPRQTVPANCSPLFLDRDQPFSLQPTESFTYGGRLLTNPGGISFVGKLGGEKHFQWQF